MATDAFAPLTAHSNPHPTVAVISREAGQWMLARASDGLEATFTVEVDERFVRLRRAHGASSSLFEARVGGSLGAGDVTAAIARWAVGAGLSVRSSHDEGVFRVTLTRGD